MLEQFDIVCINEQCKWNCQTKINHGIPFVIIHNSKNKQQSHKSVTNPFCAGFVKLQIRKIEEECIMRKHTSKWNADKKQPFFNRKA